MESNKKLEIIVGLFMVSMFIMLGYIILSLGKKKGYVGETTTVYAYFKDISGLKADAGIYLQGKYIGSVKLIEFPKTKEENEVKVTLSIRQPFVQFIKKDSTAKITTSGIFGGKQVNISGGKSDIVITEGDTIKGVVASDPINAVETAGNVLIKTDQILEDIGNIVNQYGDSGILDRILVILDSAVSLISAVENNKGLVGALIHEPAYKNKVDKLLNNLIAITDNTNAILVDIKDITSEVKNNKNSIVNRLIYDDSGKQLFESLIAVSNDAKKITSEVINGKGLVHDVIYNESKVMALVNDSMLKLNLIVNAINEGKGSLGAVIMDPTIYEDLKSVFGKVKQNETLKSLIRFSIEREGK